MKILQICHKPPYPLIDGGCIAIKNISEGLIQKFGSIKLLTISTLKHPFIENEYPKNFMKKSQLEHVFVDTSFGGTTWPQRGWQKPCKTKPAWDVLG